VAERTEEDATRPNTGRQTCGNRRYELPSCSAHIFFWSFAAAGLAADLSTKGIIFRWLENAANQRISIIDGLLRLVMAENAGAAFGIATGRRLLLVAVSVVALFVILAVFFLSSSEKRLVHIALGLFTAGVCGNLYDRLFNDGLVRDFIDVVYWPGRHWPAFNVADSLLCVAVGLLIIGSFFNPKASRTPARQQK